MKDKNNDKFQELKTTLSEAVENTSVKEATLIDFHIAWYKALEEGVSMEPNSENAGIAIVNFRKQ